MSIGEARRISDRSGRRVALLWMLVALCGAVSAPIAWVLPAQLAQGQPAALIALLFPLAGLVLLVAALRQTVRQQRYGELELEPDPDPATVGGALGGRIRLPVRLSSERDVEIVLTCLRTRVTERTHGEGASTDRAQSVLWQREGRPVVQQAAAGSVLVFRFDLPVGLPPSSAQGASAGGSHRWELAVAVRSPGMAFERSFDVPVDTTGPAPGAEIAHLPEASRHGPPPQIPASVVRITRDDGAVEFVYPPGRDVGPALVLALIGSAFIGAVVLLHALPGAVTTTIGGFAVERAGAGLPVWAIALFSGLGALCIGLGVFLVGNALHVRVSSSLLSARRTLLGLELWTRTMPRATVGDIVPEIAITQLGSTRPRVPYRLRAVPVEAQGTVGPGARHPRQLAAGSLLVGVSLGGSLLAERVRAEMRRTLGLRS